MSDLSDLIAQKAALEKRIEQAQREARSSAIAQVKTLMADHGLTMADLAGKPGPAPGQHKLKGSRVPAKYRDSATGLTWSGRGLQPKWLQKALASGRKLSDFQL